MPHQGQTGLSGLSALSGGQSVAESLLTGLISWWGMHEAAGNSRANSVSGGVALAEQGATVPLVAGILGGAANFAGGAGKFLSGTWATAASAFTIACWVKPASLVNGSIPLIIGDDAGTSYAGFSFSNVGLVAFSVSDTSITGGAVAAGSWRHLVGSYDGTNLSLYVNGVLVAQQADPGGPADLGGASVVAVGENGTGSVGALRAAVELCGVWNRALTDGGVAVGNAAQGEVSALYNGGAGRDYPFR